MHIKILIYLCIILCFAKRVPGNIHIAFTVPRYKQVSVAVAGHVNEGVVSHFGIEYIYLI